jgi:hypothetical protein
LWATLLAACSVGGGPEPSGERSLSIPCCSALQFGRDSEAHDTAVRDAVVVAVYCAVVEDRRLPNSYGMFTEVGDQQIARIIEPYVARARKAVEGATRAERIRAIWGDDWGVNVGVETQDCDDAGLRPER